MMSYRRPLFNREWISDEKFFNVSDIEGEVWIDFDSFRQHELSHFYQVSNKGRIRHFQGDILKGSVDDDGYHVVGLSRKHSDSYVYLKVHQIVLRLFKGDPPSDMKDPTVQHINHNKLDNRLENLCWLSAFDNNQEGHARRVKVIDDSGENIFSSQKLASKYIGRYEDYVAECISKGYNITNHIGESVEVWTEINNQWVKYVRPDPANRNRCKLVRAGQSFEFESFLKCDSFLGQPQGYVSNMISNSWPILSNEEHSFYIYDIDTQTFNRYIPTKQRTKKFACKCQLIDADNRSYIFPSISAVSRYIDRDSEYVRNAIRNSRPITNASGQVVTITLIED